MPARRRRAAMRKRRCSRVVAGRARTCTSAPCSPRSLAASTTLLGGGGYDRLYVRESPALARRVEDAIGFAADSKGDSHDLALGYAGQHRIGPRPRTTST